MHALRSIFVGWGREKFHARRLNQGRGITITLVFNGQRPFWGLNFFIGEKIFSAPILHKNIFRVRLRVVVVYSKVGKKCTVDCNYVRRVPLSLEGI